MSDEENRDSLVDGDEVEESTSQPQKKGGFLSPFLIRILTIILGIIGMIIIAFVVSFAVFRLGRPLSPSNYLTEGC